MVVASAHDGQQVGTLHQASEHAEDKSYSTKDGSMRTSVHVS